MSFYNEKIIPLTIAAKSACKWDTGGSWVHIASLSFNPRILEKKNHDAS